MTVSSTENWLKSLGASATANDMSTPEHGLNGDSFAANGSAGGSRSSERRRNVAASLDFVEVDQQQQGRQTPTFPTENGSRSAGAMANNSFARSGNERLYEAYNELHSLAQDFSAFFCGIACI